MKRYIISESHLKYILESNTQEVQFNMYLKQSGINIPQEVISELFNGCMPEVPKEYSGIINQFNELIKNMSREDMIKVLRKIMRGDYQKEIKSTMHSIQEQEMPSIIIAGINVPGSAVNTVLGIILMMIIMKIASLFGGGRKIKTPCKQNARLVYKVLHQKNQ